MPRRALSLAIWLAITAPVCAIAARAAFGDLGANPVETLEHETGEWAIRLLLATLAVTPLRRVAGWQAIARFRRRLGLAAFAYAASHAAIWAIVDNGLDLAAIAEDLTERPYVIAGAAALATMTPLAVTSTRRAMRALGKRWIVLHRLAYAAGVLAVVHFWWLTKKDLREPIVYALVLAALLAARLVPRRGR